MLPRWRLRLYEFVFDIIHWSGIDNQAADALSGPKSKGEEYIDINDDSLVAIINHYEDKSEETKASLYTVRYIYDHENKNQGQCFLEYKHLFNKKAQRGTCH